MVNLTCTQHEIWPSLYMDNFLLYICYLFHRCGGIREIIKYDVVLTYT